MTEQMDKDIIIYFVLLGSIFVFGCLFACCPCCLSSIVYSIVWCLSCLSQMKNWIKSVIQLQDAIRQEISYEEETHTAPSNSSRIARPRNRDRNTESTENINGRNARYNTVAIQLQDSRPRSYNQSLSVSLPPEIILTPSQHAINPECDSPPSYESLFPK